MCRRKKVMSRRWARVATPGRGMVEVGQLVYCKRHHLCSAAEAVEQLNGWSVRQLELGDGGRTSQRAR